MNDIEGEIQELQRQLSDLKIPPSLFSLGLIILALLVTWIVIARFDLVVLIVAIAFAALLYVLMFAYQEKRIQRIGERRVLATLMVYKQTLRDLSRDPENPELEGETIYAGRRYLRVCRSEGRIPVIDEPQIRSDIAVARGNQPPQTASGRQPNIDGPQSTGPSP